MQQEIFALIRAAEARLIMGQEDMALTCLEDAASLLRESMEEGFDPVMDGSSGPLGEGHYTPAPARRYVDHDGVLVVELF